ncbi:MAG: hypothetical protein Q4Q04_01205, partial [Methanocorpusculum sp.]|nr:hypothetical protein [Methanocorpusculum sp.]
MFSSKKRKEAGNHSLPPYKYERDGTLVQPTYAKNTKVIESYWITPGLSRVSIIRNEAYEYVYYTHEPTLTEFEAELLDRLHSGVRDLLIIKEIVVKDRKQALYEAIDVLIEEYHLGIDVEPASVYKIRY